MAKLFFSYSHKDEALRDELETHLSMLKRQGIIETWHDRRIGAGKEFDTEICEYLSDANIILLLVSPYFLASDYCYNIELDKALEMHKLEKAVVIPVILHPCDWHSSSFGKLTATPTDGKPVSKHPNQHDAFLDVTKAIRKVAPRFNNSGSNNSESSVHNASAHKSYQENIVTRELPRSSNLRVKKEFNDREIDTFIEESFEYIANFFEGSLNELEKRNTEIQAKYKRIDTNHFTASIYKSGRNISSCKIWLGGFHHSTNQISYSSDISSGDNSMNDSLSVENDGHTLSLKAMGYMFGNSSDTNKMTPEGGAEYFWEQLVNPLQN